MKKILLATTLLSIAMSENILMENHLRPRTVWIRDKPFWNRKVKRLLQNDASSEVEEFLNYDDERQFPRVSDTRFIGETRKPPTVAIIRRPNVAQFSQVDLLSSDKSKSDSGKPTILISIDIEESKKTGNNLCEDCSTKKTYHHKHNQSWQIQAPFYVEEPRWVEIDPEYTDGSSRCINCADPYILSRGKKIFRIRDQEQADKIIEDYEFDYPSKTLLAKNRVRRSIEMNEKSQNHIINENKKKETNYYNSLQDTDEDNIVMKTKNGDKFFEIDEKFTDGKAERGKSISPAYDVSVKKYEKDKLNSTKRSRERSQTSANGVVIANFVDQEQKTRREHSPNNIVNRSGETAKAGQDKRFYNGKNHLATDTNKRNKRSALLKNRKLSEVRKKQKAYEIDWLNSAKAVERNETDVSEENKPYIDKVDDFDVYDDPFILSHGKNSFGSETKSSNDKDVSDDKTDEKPWNMKHRPKIESDEEARNVAKSGIDNDDPTPTDSQSTKPDSNSFGIKNYPNYREKRYACERCEIMPPLQDELWLKNIERSIQNSLSLAEQRRDKHSDIFERLTQPFIISRGKKAPREFKSNLFPTSEPRDADEANRAKTTDLLLMKSLLKMLLMQRYNNNNCDTNGLPNKMIPRDRRNPFDKILSDPFYLARGKRTNLNDFLTEMRPLQNKKFETDAKYT